MKVSGTQYVPLNEVLADMYSLSMLGAVAVSRVDSGRGSMGRDVIVVVGSTAVVVVEGVGAVAVVTDGCCHANTWTLFFE